jgi:hypothetical protein
MTESQTNFRATDMPSASRVTATPATIARFVAPKQPVGPTPTVEDAPVADVEVAEEA